MLKIKNILISQPKPEEGIKSPYLDIAAKYDVNVVFRPFIKVEGYTLNEFSKQKIDIPNYSAIVFVARTGVDQFFRLAKEGKVKIVPEMKYFCLNESFAFYIQKYIKFRKRKIFSAPTGRLNELFAMIEKNANEKFLFILPQTGNEEVDKFLEKSKINYDRALGVQSLLKSFPKFEQGEIYFGCLGASAAQAIRDAGFRVDLEVPNPQFSSMTLAVEDFIQKNQKGSKK